MQTETHDILLDAEQFEVLVIKCHHAHELLLELFLRAIDVGVIHLHRADAHQAEEFARFLVAVARPVFREADGQIAVGALL